MTKTKGTAIDTTVCSQCGYAFSCGVAADDSACWCFSYPRRNPLPDDDLSTESGCLCPYCLNKIIITGDERHGT